MLRKIASGGVPGKFNVIASATRGFIALYKGKLLDAVPCIGPKKVSKPKTEPKRASPSEDRPFRQSIHQMPLYSSDLAYSEIRKMLEDVFLSKYA